MRTCVVFMSVLAVGWATITTPTPKQRNTADKAVEESKYITCDGRRTGDPLPTTKWIDIRDECVTRAREQIWMEFEAALLYIQLGSHFSQYDVNRPGYAKFFFGAASEERQHAIKIFEYLLMRGPLDAYNPVPDLQTLLGTSEKKSAKLYELSKMLEGKLSGLEGLNKALEYEVDVTSSIKEMIKVCEKVTESSDKEEKANEPINDYHMVDWLITDLLDEQLKGQRELAGRISTLDKMKLGYGQIADFLYDKQLLEELDAKAA